MLELEGVSAWNLSFSDLMINPSHRLLPDITADRHITAVRMTVSEEDSRVTSKRVKVTTPFVLTEEQ